MIAERREAASCFFHANQNICIGGSCVAAETANNGFIAGQLHVPVCQHIHDPNQRIEPVYTCSRDQKQLGNRVEPPDVYKFVLQNVLQRRFVVPICLFGHQNDRVQDAEGQGRRNLVRLPDADPAPQRMRLQPLPGRIIVHWKRHAELPAAFPVNRREKGCAENHPGNPYNAPYGDCLHRCSVYLRQSGDSLPRQKGRSCRCGHVYHVQGCLLPQQ